MKHDDDPVGDGIIGFCVLVLIFAALYLLTIPRPQARTVVTTEVRR